MSILRDLKAELESLKSCFNCKKKFDCLKARSIENSPCEDWVNGNKVGGKEK